MISGIPVRVSRISGENISLRWHYPHQVTGRNNYSLLSAGFLPAPLLFKKTEKGLAHHLSTADYKQSVMTIQLQSACKISPVQRCMQ